MLKHIGKKILNELFPGSAWRRCRVPTPAERLAEWNRRMGIRKAEKIMQEAMVAQQLDVRWSKRAQVFG